jgi:sugar transferase (PEP-CTERM/EpsH1 system associated)
VNRRIHIQHVLLSLEPGGLENGVVNVINGLDAGRFHSSVTCLKRSGPFAARIKRSDVEVHAMGLTSGNDIGLPLRLARLFRRTRPDVVHTRNAESFFYGFMAAKLAGVRALVHSEHGRVLPDSPRRMAVQRWMLRFTDASFAVSEQLRRDMVHHVGVSPQRMEVIYNGVDVERFERFARAEARRALGAADGELVIGSVGRLVAVKNYELLVRAFGRLAATGTKLVFIGEGQERPKLEAAAASCGAAARVVLMGHRDDVASLLPGLDVFVLPSLSEGMSNTLLEAMAAGVAVVASDVGGNGEIILDKQTGLLFASGDEAGLHGHLAALVADPARRAQLAAAGKSRALGTFSMGAMVRGYEALYERVVGHGSN